MSKTFFNLKTTYMMKLFKSTTKLLLFGALLMAQSSFAMVETYPGSSPNLTDDNGVAINSQWMADFKNNPEMKNLPHEMAKMNLDEFLNLTPAKYEEMTGKKLGIVKKFKLKVAQKFLKSKKASTSDIPKVLYVLLALIGLGWLAMGLLDNFSGSDWIISLVLYLLFFLPGLIYTLIKMSKYY